MIRKKIIGAIFLASFVALNLSACFATAAGSTTKLGTDPEKDLMLFYHKWAHDELEDLTPSDPTDAEEVLTFLEDSYDTVQRYSGKKTDDIGRPVTTPSEIDITNVAVQHLDKTMASLKINFVGNPLDWGTAIAFFAWTRDSETEPALIFYGQIIPIFGVETYYAYYGEEKIYLRGLEVHDNALLVSFHSDQYQDSANAVWNVMIVALRYYGGDHGYYVDTFSNKEAVSAFPIWLLIAILTCCGLGIGVGAFLYLRKRKSKRGKSIRMVKRGNKN